MKDKRRAMEKTLLFFFIGTVTFVVMFIAYHLIKSDWDMILWGHLTFYAFIIVVCNHTLSHERQQYINLYYDGRKLLSDMIRIIDWTTFRKRQLYHTNDLSAVNDINMFLIESQETLSPVKDGLQYYRLTVLSLNSILTSSMMALIILHRQYIKDLLRYSIDLIGFKI